MEKHSEKSWLRFLVFIYGIAFCFLLVAASVTAYVLSHPELGLKETNPIVRDYVSQYGLELRLLLVNLYNFGTIFVSWLLFISYLVLSRKYKWKKTLAHSLVYSGIVASGNQYCISHSFISKILRSLGDSRLAHITECTRICR
jgi:hypothetical protein